MTYVQLRNAEKFYTNGTVVPVLRGIDLDVDTAEVVCITGRSGSGKSTLLNVLGLLATPSAGSYLLGGVDVTAPQTPRAALRASAISTIFQQGNLFPHLTALENVAVGLNDQRDEDAARAALARTGLAELADRRAGLLSGGEQQRVSVARAIARRSTLVLADEPTASLDADNADAVLGLLLEAASAGAAVIIASHDPRVAERAHRQVRLEEGRISC